MTDTDRPDAVILPDSIKVGDDALARSHSTLAHAERFLCVNKAAGEQAHARPNPGGAWFCTRSGSVRDTLLFPTSHERSGTPRYEWRPQPDGSILGYLTELAKEDLVATA